MITSAECGGGRNSTISCPPTCAFNPFAPPGYDSWLRLDGAWTLKAIAWIESCVGENAFRDTVRGFRGKGDGEDGLEMDLAFPAAVHWLLSGFRDSAGRSLGERWEKAGWPALNNDERVMSRFRCRSFATLLEVQHVVDSQSVSAVDLWAGKKAKPFLMVDRSAARQFRPFDILLSWITPYPHFVRFVGTAVVLPRDLREAFEDDWVAFAREELNLKKKPTSDQLKEILGKGFGFAVDLVHDLGRESIQQTLRGSDIEACRIYFSFAGKRLEILEALRSLPEFEADDEASDENLPDSDTFMWLRRGESKKIEAYLPRPFQHSDDESAGVGVLGRICVGQTEVMVRTIGRQKVEFAHARLIEIFGPRLRFERESRTNLALQMAERLEREWNPLKSGRKNFPPAKSEEAGSKIPLEAKTHLIRSALERNFQGLADAELPIFGGHSAREAALDPRSRPAVIEWVKDQWYSIGDLSRREGIALDDIPRKLAKELGLHELIGSESQTKEKL